MRETLRSEEIPATIQLHGAVAGVIGAVVVAVVYLVMDAAVGRPLYTPNALGAAVFRGDSLGLDAPIEAALVLGYTLLHGGVFVGFGLLTSFVFLEAMSRLRAAGTGLAEAAIAAAALFAAFEVLFEIFGWLFVPGQGQLGGTRAVIANALAAIAMASYLEGVRTRYVRADLASAAGRARSSSGPG